MGHHTILLMAEIPNNHLGWCWNPIKSGIFSILTGAGFRPSTVSQGFFNMDVLPVWGGFSAFLLDKTAVVYQAASEITFMIWSVVWTLKKISLQFVVWFFFCDTSCLHNPTIFLKPYLAPVWAYWTPPWLCYATPLLRWLVLNSCAFWRHFPPTWRIIPGLGYVVK